MKPNKNAGNLMRFTSSTMRTRLPIAILAAAASTIAPHVMAMAISGPLTASQVNALATASGATYGPPPAVNYYEPGPLVVPSGTSANLYAGPGQTSPGGNTINTILITVSLDPSSLASLGTVSFNLSGVGTVSFGSGDFFTTSAVGFPNGPGGINGIANGVVNGIAFPTAEHAALEITGLGLPLSTGSILGSAIITSPVDLRLDVFGIAPAEDVVTKDRGISTTNSYPVRIVNNTPNSGALGVTTHVPDGGTTVLLMGSALACLGAVARRIKA